MDTEERILGILARKPKSSKHKVARILSKTHEESEVFYTIDKLLASGRLYLYNGKGLCIESDKKRTNLNDRRLREYRGDEHHRTLRRVRATVIRKLNRGRPVRDKKLAAILGCSVADFAKHLESQFEPGMSWENWGVGRDKWHIDHIVPCAYFDLTDPAQLRKCFHYSNQQPLWSTDNTVKGATTRKTDVDRTPPRTNGPDRDH